MSERVLGNLRHHSKRDWEGFEITDPDSAQWVYNDNCPRPHSDDIEVLCAPIPTVCVSCGQPMVFNHNQYMYEDNDQKERVWDCGTSTGQCSNCHAVNWNMTPEKTYETT